jgi:biopolymer transport protein ExbD
MAFLRKGLLKSAHRRNELYCRIDLPAVAIGIFFLLLLIFMLNPFPYHRIIVDRVVARHIHKLPGAIREDAITIYIRRDGTVYFGNSKIRPDDLSHMVRDAVHDGAERRIYLEVDARALCRDVNALLPQIQMSGIENISILAESPRPAAAPSSLPTP